MGTEIDRLTVVWDADISRLEDKLNKVIRSNHGAAKKVEDAWAHFEPSKALESVFSRSRLAVFEEGASKISVFGSALEKLGPIGLGAAAGIAAVAVAMEEAHKAAEFADSIEKAAKASHVGTDTLQEYRFALEEAGGEAQGADAALQGFSETLGKAREGLPKAVQAFHALRIEPEQLKSMRDTGDLLDLVIERISEIRDNPQKDAIIEQLGLKSMAPLILEGVDKIRELRREAVGIGAVMDAGLIQRGAEANRKFEALAKVVDIQLKSAFVDLAPILTGLLSIAASFAREIAGIVDHLRNLPDKTTQGLVNEIKHQSEIVNEDLANGASLNNAEVVVALRRMNRARELLDERNAARNPEAPAGDRDLVPKPKTPKAAPHDDTIEQTKAAAEALDQAQRDAANAYRALTDSLTERERFELLALQAENQKQADALQAQIAKVEADKGISDATRRELLAKLEETRWTQVAAAIAKQRKLLLDAAVEQDRLILADQAAIAPYYDDIARMAADMATTAAERQRIERRLLDAQQKRERAERDQAVREAQAAVDAGVSGAGERLSQAKAEQAGALDRQAAQNKQFDIEHLTGFAALFRQMHKDVDDIGASLENAAAQGLSDLNDGLATAIGHGNKLLEVVIKLVLEMAELALFDRKGGGGFGSTGDLINAASSFGAQGGGGGGGGIGDVVRTIFSFFTGGHASGGYIPPGHWGMTGEQGPEPVFGGRTGVTVLPNSALRAPSIPRLVAGGGATVVQPVHFDLRGAVVTEDLVRQMNGIAARHASQAEANAVRASARGFGARQRQYDLLSGD